MKRIKGHEDYAITSCGRVWSFKSGSPKEISIRQRPDGYRDCTLDGKKFYVHKLVAEAYLPNPNGYDSVDHIVPVLKGGKDNVQNLQWMPMKANIVKEQGKKIRCIELDLYFNSQTEAAKHFGCCHQNISNCLRGKAKTACGYHWEVV